MQMTETEIIRRYKHAADRRKQIKILAELNACPKETIREILRNAGCDVPATDNRYTAKAKKEAEARTAESPHGLLPDADEAQIGWCPEQKVGTTSEDPGKKMFGDSLEAKKAAPTACQPAQPVDVWNTGDVPVVIITLARDELERINRDIAGMETEIELIQSTIDQLNFTKKEINAFLQKAEGRQA